MYMHTYTRMLIIPSRHHVSVWRVVLDYALVLGWAICVFMHVPGCPCLLAAVSSACSCCLAAAELLPCCCLATAWLPPTCCGLRFFLFFSTAVVPSQASLWIYYLQPPPIYPLGVPVRVVNLLLQELLSCEAMWVVIVEGQEPMPQPILVPRARDPHINPILYYTMTYEIILCYVILYFTMLYYIIYYILY